MKWNQYTIHTTTEAEDSIAYLLSELGIDGVEIVDKKEVLEGDTKDLFEDVMPVQDEDDGKADVIFYLSDDADDGPVLDAVLKGLNEMRSYLDPGECTIVRSVTEDQDWANNWKTYFHAFTVGDFLIKPTWVEVPENMTGRYVIEIDPGSAFGTGSHETTKLCITALEKYVKPGDRILDVGTGSGILSIAAVKLGASEAFGTDIDELAVTAAAENRDRNQIGADRFRIRLGDIITD
ncbi:MAG: 50S ribosomal protein L11 methyltransferase, partial [Lachnospiraceae bacterium]|nr:50S ribosomal protein L11 methyltransferase [Lachnospiraceae bacterium]